MGVTLPSALVLTSGLLMMAFPAVMYLGGVRLTGTQWDRPWGVLIFVTAGGIGFWSSSRTLAGRAWAVREWICSLVPVPLALVLGPQPHRLRTLGVGQHKFFSFFRLFGSLLIGSLLARLGSLGPAHAGLAAGLTLTLGLAGTLDLIRAADAPLSSLPLIDGGGEAATDWVRSNTGPHDVLLVAPNHNEPVTILSGRPLVVGFKGSLWTRGLNDWDAKTSDATSMLRGEPGTPELLLRYQVRYVVIGPQELGNPWRADGRYWAVVAGRSTGRAATRSTASAETLESRRPNLGWAGRRRSETHRVARPPGWAGC